MTTPLLLRRAIWNALDEHAGDEVDAASAVWRQTERDDRLLNVLVYLVSGEVRGATAAERRDVLPKIIVGTLRRVMQRELRAWRAARQR